MWNFPLDRSVQQLDQSETERSGQQGKKISDSTAKPASQCIFPSFGFLRDFSACKDHIPHDEQYFDFSEQIDKCSEASRFEDYVRYPCQPPLEVRKFEQLFSPRAIVEPQSEARIKCKISGSRYSERRTCQDYKINTIKDEIR
jgi:hypothetical protein